MGLNSVVYVQFVLGGIAAPVCNYILVSENILLFEQEYVG